MISPSARADGASPAIRESRSVQSRAIAPSCRRVGVACVFIAATSLSVPRYSRIGLGNGPYGSLCARALEDKTLCRAKRLQWSRAACAETRIALSRGLPPTEKGKSGRGRGEDRLRAG